MATVKQHPAMTVETITDVGTAGRDTMHNEHRKNYLILFLIIKKMSEILT